MNIKILGFLSAALMVGPMVANAQFLYTYTGNNFDYLRDQSQSPVPPYTSADRLTIQLTTSTPLPANQSSQRLPFINMVSLSFNDGVESIVYSPSDLVITRFATNVEGDLTTNSAGVITDWDIEGLLFYPGSSNVLTWRSASGDSNPDLVGNNYNTAAASTVGKWTVASAPEIDPASAASGLMLLLGGLAVLRGRREKIVA
jgi:hypothetical protein